MIQSVQFFSDPEDSVLKAVTTKDTLNFSAQPTEQTVLKTPGQVT